MEIQKVFNENGRCIKVFYIKEDYTTIEVELFEQGRYGGIHRGWGVNWGSYGTQTPKDTDDFALLLLEAAAQALQNSLLEIENK